MLWLPILPGVGPYHKPPAEAKQVVNQRAIHRGADWGQAIWRGASKPSEQFLHSLSVSQLQQPAGWERKSGLADLRTEENRLLLCPPGRLPESQAL